MAHVARRSLSCLQCPKCKYRVVIGVSPQSPLFVCSAGSRGRCLLEACEEAFFRGHTTERLMVSRPTPEIPTRSTSCGASGGGLQTPCSRGWLLAGANIVVALATLCATICLRRAFCGPWPHDGCHILYHRQVVNAASARV